MKLKIVDQDIITSPDQVIAHCCNLKNRMGSGVAKVLRDRYPEVYKADTAAYIKYGKELFGKCELVPIEPRASVQTLFVANLYGQCNFGKPPKRYINYEAFYLALESLKKQIKERKLTSLSLPYRIGCDRAGGNWNIVVTMIDEVFNDSTITATLYRLNSQTKNICPTCKP